MTAEPDNLWTVSIASRRKSTERMFRIQNLVIGSYPIPRTATWEVDVLTDPPKC
jgi:hypothetical protein